MAQSTVGRRKRRTRFPARSRSRGLQVDAKETGDSEAVEKHRKRVSSTTLPGVRFLWRSTVDPFFNTPTVSLDYSPPACGGCTLSFRAQRGIPYRWRFLVGDSSLRLAPFGMT